MPIPVQLTFSNHVLATPVVNMSQHLSAPECNTQLVSNNRSVAQPNLPVSFYHLPAVRFLVTTDTNHEPTMLNTVATCHPPRPTIEIFAPFSYAAYASNPTIVWQWFRISAADLHLHSHCYHCRPSVYSSAQHPFVHFYVANRLSIVARIYHHSTTLQRMFECI